MRVSFFQAFPITPPSSSIDAGRPFKDAANGTLTSDSSSTPPRSKACPPHAFVSSLYDVENRLVSASGAKTANLVYDPMGGAGQGSGGAHRRWKASGGRLFRTDGGTTVSRIQ